MNKHLITLLICIISLVGCTVVPKPTYIIDTQPSFDSSTPAKYTDKQNSGFIGFLQNGNGIVTSNAVNRYNNLLDKYQTQLLDETGTKIEKNSGIFPIDGNNMLYEIDQQHLYYFILMNQWNKQNKQK